MLLGLFLNQNSTSIYKTLLHDSILSVQLDKNTRFENRQEGLHALYTPWAEQV